MNYINCWCVAYLNLPWWWWAWLVWMMPSLICHFCSGITLRKLHANIKLLFLVNTWWIGYYQHQISIVSFLSRTGVFRRRLKAQICTNMIKKSLLQCGMGWCIQLIFSCCLLNSDYSIPSAHFVSYDTQIFFSLCIWVYLFKSPDLIQRLELMKCILLWSVTFLWC